MDQAPFTAHGFTYSHDGKEFAFHIVAASREDALARLSSMGAATYAGKVLLAPVGLACTVPPAAEAATAA